MKPDLPGMSNEGSGAEDRWHLQRTSLPLGWSYPTDSISLFCTKVTTEKTNERNRIALDRNGFTVAFIVLLRRSNFKT